MLRAMDRQKGSHPVVAHQGPPVEIMGLSVDRFSPINRFFILTTAIFAFYILYGYFQELIFRLDGIKPFSLYLTLVQFAQYSIFACLESRFIKKDTSRRIPWKVYFILAFLTLATMAMSNSSVAYLNYPTQVMFKCCKLIPVLVGSVLIQGKLISIMDFLAAICMSLGLIFFTLADAQVSPNFDTTGIIMILLALTADAGIGNVQEKNMKLFKASNTEVVLYSYSLGFVYLFVFMVVTDQLYEAFLFCIRHPVETYGYFTIFSITGYMGVQAVLTMINYSGVFVAVTVTTCRKAVTIILSFVFFSKPFTSQYLWSGLLVVFGIYLNVYSKKGPPWVSNLTLTTLLTKMRHNLRRARQTPDLSSMELV